MTDAFTLFRSSLPASFHAQVVDLTRGMAESAAHDPALPGLGIVNDPIVRAVVARFLGPGAVPDACRHIHWNSGARGGGWHQDLYDERPWPATPRFVMLFYYPQDTPGELGPTEVRDDDGTEHLMAGPAGTCFVLRHDAWHRATANRAGLPRVMLRNLFRGAPGTFRDHNDAAHIREYIADAARWLHRSMETTSSMARAHCCIRASEALLMAAGLADGEERAILDAHYRQAETLAGQFYGDGMGAQRLLDELVRAKGAEQ